MPYILPVVHCTTWQGLLHLVEQVTSICKLTILFSSQPLRHSPKLLPEVQHRQSVVCKQSLHLQLTVCKGQQLPSGQRHGEFVKALHEYTKRNAKSKQSQQAWWHCRQTAAGDQLRVVYEQLSKDPNSLSNLDQDLPNYAQHSVPIHSLPMVPSDTLHY